MKYMGSKLRIAKEQQKIILKDRKPDQWYVETCVGGCNSIDKVSGKRIGGDTNKYLIAMWAALQKGWIPPAKLSRDEYAQIRDNKGDFPDELVGYVGFCCSYSGKWFGGYAGLTNTKVGTVRDYIDESYRNILKQSAKLKDVIFYNLSYDQLPIPESSIIYCDPPYEGTTEYKDKFDHVAFWDWCRLKSKEGHRVFVSEYAAPSDFVCVWEKGVKSSLSANGTIGGSKDSIERLFVYGVNHE